MGLRQAAEVLEHYRWGWGGGGTSEAPPRLHDDYTSHPGKKERKKETRSDDVECGLPPHPSERACAIVFCLLGVPRVCRHAILFVRIPCGCPTRATPQDKRNRSTNSSVHTTLAVSCRATERRAHQTPPPPRGAGWPRDRPRRRSSRECTTPQIQPWLRRGPHPRQVLQRDRG